MRIEHLYFFCVNLYTFKNLFGIIAMDAEMRIRLLTIYSSIDLDSFSYECNEQLEGAKRIRAGYSLCSISRKNMTEPEVSIFRYFRVLFYPQKSVL